MSALDLLARLAAEGITVRLALDLEADAEPAPETMKLLRAHREELLDHLAAERLKSPPVTVYEPVNYLPTGEEVPLEPDPVEYLTRVLEFMKG